MQWLAPESTPSTRSLGRARGPMRRIPCRLVPGGKPSELVGPDPEAATSGGDRAARPMNPDALRTHVVKTTRSRARRSRRWRPFVQARALARSLGLRSIGEWQCWAASWERPGDIPADPYVVYQA